MASHVVVIAADLRRTTVKVTPGTYLADVLDQACKKLNLASDKYVFKHKQRQVDLSVPFRTSGLIGGAKLELVQRSNTPSAVQIALQIPQPEAREIPGGRLIKKFPSDLTLWKIMRQFESGEASAGKNINITARGFASTTSGSGQLYYETPVLNIMGREFSTFDDFQRTLAQLGHNSGNVLIRLGFRRTEQTLFEALQQISQSFEEAESQEGGAAANSTSGSATKEDSDLVAEEQRDDAAEEADAADAADAASRPDPTIESTSQETGPEATDATTDPTSSAPSEDPYQPVNVFLAPTGATPAAALIPASESDFTPTVAHAQLHQARLLQSSRNTRLPSDKELQDKAAAQEARIASIQSVLVKVRFPDNTSSEWLTGPSETGAFLYEAVRHVMADPSQKFHLLLSGSKTLIQDSSSQAHNLVKTYKFSSRVLVNLVWEATVPDSVREGPFLRANVAMRAQEVKVPEVTHVEEDVPQREVKKADKEERSEKGGDGVKKVPKWLRLGKK
ncbi:hypothetical protein E4U17_003218 [Claviceps sp. LM77 group G4]|nr:hypothetical protein E4U17_003218 [Claviceps sp. LM77 group G4]KAG6073236.1 hypothetical protein E4U16_004819 [Claviceps sp. LM84 group G4]KAG6081357.1 hypothetical protein E4U33_006851 [Claviceps sp. LM78 group G4]